MPASVSSDATLDTAADPRRAHRAILLGVTALESVQRVLGTRDDVVLAYLFGSAARGEERRSSDIDIAVLFTRVPGARDLDRLTTELAAGLRRDHVDLVVLNTASPLLAHEVVVTGRLAVCVDDVARVEFEARATARYLDTAHLRRVQHRYLRERVDTFRAGSA